MPTALFLVALGVLCIAYVIGQVRAWLAARRVARMASRRPAYVDQDDLLYLALAQKVVKGASDGELCYLASYYGARMGQRRRQAVNSKGGAA